MAGGRVADMIGEAPSAGKSRPRLRVEHIASRCLATIEAAAIDIESASPSMIGRAGQMRPSGAFAPIDQRRVPTPASSPATAYAIARSAAPRMLKSVDFLDAGENDRRR